MITQEIQKPDGKSRLRESLESAAAVAIDMGVFKKRMENAVDEAMLDAKRMARHGRHKVEDLVDDAAYRIKKAPLQSAGFAFGAGVGLGFLTGWLLTRRNGEIEH